MKKIYDCFMYSSEDDILDIRLNTVYEKVDKIVIVESTTTHRGEKKDLNFLKEKNVKRFEKFYDKINYVIVSDMPKYNDNPWELENFQRNCILRGIEDADENDIVIVSDVDEIIRPGALDNLRKSDNDLFGFKVVSFFYRLNSFEVRLGQEVMPMAIKKKILDKISPQDLRNLKHRINEDLSQEGISSIKIFKNSGWHFSWVGRTGEEYVKNKLSSYPHNSFRSESGIKQKTEQINERLSYSSKKNKDDDYIFMNLKIDSFFPKYLEENQDKFYDLLTTNVEFSNKDILKYLK
jgi:beta-1,4-mannosyl-glycoprotein beta-1,4-N-acetylglucosaminyltransferase